MLQKVGVNFKRYAFTSTQDVCKYVYVLVCLTWSDDYVVGIFNHFNSLISVDLCVCPCDLHGLSRPCGRCAIASQDHISK